MDDIGKELGFDREETNSITQYLQEEGLIRFLTLDGGIAITHAGVVEVEDALSTPNKATQHFLPVMNVINIDHIQGSQIQQSVSSSTQTLSITDETQKNISDFIETIKDKISDLGLKQEDEAELNGDVATIDAQLSSGRPKPNIVKEGLQSIKRILEGATVEALAVGLIKTVSTLIAAF